MKLLTRFFYESVRIIVIVVATNHSLKRLDDVGLICINLSGGGMVVGDGSSGGKEVDGSEKRRE